MGSLRFSDTSADYPYQVEWEYNENVVLISSYDEAQDEPELVSTREALIGDFEY